ncbi:hypothetical protein HZH66_015512 [Vespula vulgaris]|uniref:Uncharacterized protein n=1 Tax=Vespula vulgaris TaxID=7454 RepID=A0A834J3W6_VESVU|nr:hypothetical protein HZH66_015512 [Vespula vulgaris]
MIALTKRRLTRNLISSRGKSRNATNMKTKCLCYIQFYQMKDVSGKIAFVTGAGGELGRSLALGLANLGVIVVIWDIRKVNFPTTKYLCHEFDGFGIEKTMKVIKAAGGTCYGCLRSLQSRGHL